MVLMNGRSVGPVTVLRVIMPSNQNSRPVIRTLPWKTAACLEQRPLETSRWIATASITQKESGSISAADLKEAQSCARAPQSRAGAPLISAQSQELIYKSGLVGQCRKHFSLSPFDPTKHKFRRGYL